MASVISQLQEHWRSLGYNAPEDHPGEYVTPYAQTRLFGDASFIKGAPSVHIDKFQYATRFVTSYVSEKDMDEGRAEVDAAFKAAGRSLFNVRFTPPLYQITEIRGTPPDIEDLGENAGEWAFYLFFNVEEGEDT